MQSIQSYLKYVEEIEAKIPPHTVAQFYDKQITDLEHVAEQFKEEKQYLKAIIDELYAAKHRLIAQHAALVCRVRARETAQEV